MGVELRCSRLQDLPRLRELWQLTFGDSQEYMDCFFDRCPGPEHILVLEQDGAVQAMTAWFDMPLVGAGGTQWPAAYLYAVATHPETRGRGYAGQLLAFCGRWLKERGFACLTTVPARPDLHVFFGANGFEENFTLARSGFVPGKGRAELKPVDGAQYARIREGFLSGMAHVSYGDHAIGYQQGVCRLSGGGLYAVEGGCACVERGEDGLVVVKELLTGADCRSRVLDELGAAHPGERYEVRSPWPGEGERVAFGMIRWLDGVPEGWDGQNAYLGLAFD